VDAAKMLAIRSMSKARSLWRRDLEGGGAMRSGSSERGNRNSEVSLP
jgi:hypothetical protein